MNRLDKSVLLGSVLLTFMGGLTSSKAVIASTFQCVETVSFCVRTSGGYGSGDCVERLSVCNRYHQDVLKCEQWINAYDMRLVYYHVVEKSWECGYDQYCVSKKTCESRGGSYHGWYGSGCGVGHGTCKEPKTCTLTRSRYDRVNVRVCSRWDINVKFGNAEIDPNLIEY